MSRTTLSLVLIGALCAAGAARAATEQEFLSKAIKGDNSEVALGNLAAERGGSVGVKSYGKVLVTDHTQHRQEVETLARQMGAPAPTEKTPEAEQEYSKLSGLSGAEFDKEFVADMIMDHEKDIAEYKQEADSGKGPVAKLAAQSLPVLERHLKLAEGLKGKP